MAEQIFEVVFNAENYCSGIDFYWLEAANKVKNKKMLLIKVA